MSTKKGFNSIVEIHVDDIAYPKEGKPPWDEWKKYGVVALQLGSNFVYLFV